MDKKADIARVIIRWRSDPANKLRVPRSTEPARQTAHERHARARRLVAHAPFAADPLRPRLCAFSGHFCAGRWTR